jgi:spermidine synthase
MTRLPSRASLYVAFLVLGVYAQIAQALLVREGLVAFYGNEVSLGAFFGSWLFWTAVGSLAATRWQGRGEEALGVLRVVLLLLPVVLLLELGLFRAVRWVLSTAAGELVPLGQLLGSIALLNLPTGLAIGLAFPLAVQGLRLVERDPAGANVPGAVRAASALYALDAFGALAGGLLITFVLIDALGVWRSAALGLVGLGAVVAWLAPGARAWHAAGGIAAAAGVLLVVPAVGVALDTAMERWRFAALQPGLTLVDAVETRYGHFAVGRRGGQLSTVADGRVEGSFPDPEAARQDAAYYHSQADGPRRILLLGGVAGGLAAELLRYPLERLVVVQSDEQAFARLRPHLLADDRQALADPRLSLRFADGRQYVNDLSGTEGFDLVLVLAGDPASAQANRYYTRQFYAAVRRGMAPDGVLCTAVGGASNYFGREVQGYGASVFRTLGQAFAHVAVLPGDTQVYCASAIPGRVTEDPALLERRYLGMPLEEHRFPAIAFHSLLPAEHVRYTRARLGDPPGELNTDERPVTYWLNMVLWGKLSASGLVGGLERLRAMGPWPYLLPPALLVGLLLLRAANGTGSRARARREAAVLGLATLGFVAMAAQLVLLFSYQARVGFVFGRVALLNGVFMAGLAFGAGWLGAALAPRAAWALPALLGLVAGSALALPHVLSAVAGLDGTTVEAAYLGLCFAAGLLTGAGFPLAVDRTQRDTGNALRSSAVSQGADSLGGAAGGLLTGALLVPTLGLAGTSGVLGAAAALAAVPLLYAEYGPARLRWLAARAHPAFPSPAVVGALGFVVLFAGGMALLARGAAPGPQVRFDAGLLEAVSGATDFAERAQPFVHYVGLAPDGRAVAALGSEQLAAAVRGYGGPINLLVAVDEAGTLRGVRHLASRETPSYVAGIDDWLGRLRGQSLADGPLTLDRVDALSGATLTSRAALDSLSLAVRAVGPPAFGRSLAGQAAPRPPAWRQPGFVATLALLVLLAPVYRSGSDRARVVYLVAALAVLGVWLNTPLTEIDVLNLSLGQFAGLADNPQRWLLIAFAATSTVLFGPVWCGYLCPFGALQELLGRAGRLLRLRSYPDRSVETRVRFVKYVLLAAVLLVGWWTGETWRAAFDPMQHVFAGRWTGWVGALTVVVLGAAVIHFRFWCRYFCPVGALLNLGNKLALAGRFGPARRIERCDLGVTHEYDVDCIRCQRCVEGRDLGLPHHAPPRNGPPPILGGRRE